MNRKSLAIAFAAGTFFTGRLLSQTAAPEPSLNPVGPAAAPAASPAGPVAPLQTTPSLESSTSMPPAPEVAPVEKPPKPKPHTSIEIDLQTQKAYLLRDGKKIAEAPISSGRAGHLTPRGDFEVVEKDLNHKSSLYGQIVDKSTGRVVVAGADSAMPVPRGCKFVAAPMRYFLRFEGAAGMHAGILPGYPASHGCVRMPAAKAKLFYETTEVGSPVHVFGNAPTRAVAAAPRKSSPSTRTERIARADENQRQEEEIPPPAPPQEARRNGWLPFFFRR